MRSQICRLELINDSVRIEWAIHAGRSKAGDSFRRTRDIYAPLLHTQFLNLVKETGFLKMSLLPRFQPEEENPFAGLAACSRLINHTDPIHIYADYVPVLRAISKELHSISTRLDTWHQVHDNQDHTQCESFRKYWQGELPRTQEQFVKLMRARRVVVKHMADHLELSGPAPDYCASCDGNWERAWIVRKELDLLFEIEATRAEFKAEL
jgi:hypothetical protein